MKQLLHTPEGVRDIYNSECSKRMALSNQLHKAFKRFGYFDIQTPTFEFFDIFSKEKGSVVSREMFKFFDREGNTLVLRPDMTPSIARCVSKYYVEEDCPIRLCYTANTFINNSSLQGRLKEMTQLGAELIGDDSPAADAELIALIVECLKVSGLTDFQIDIGEANFLKELIKDAGISDEAAEKLKQLIEKRNYFGVEEMFSEMPVDDHISYIFCHLNDFVGSIDQIMQVKKYTNNPAALKAVERLAALHQILQYYDVASYVSFDLGMLVQYQYYTGIIIKGFTYGTGEAIVSGGRYDTLIEKFGKDSPAIGFGLSLDSLMAVLMRQGIYIRQNDVNTLLLYEDEDQKAAVEMASGLRKDGLNLQLLAKAKDKPIEDYEAFARRNYIRTMYYLNTKEHSEPVIKKIEG